MAQSHDRPTGLPAGRGLAWLNVSLVLLRRQPLRLLILGLVLQFLAGLTQVGVLGILFVLLVPALTAGMLQAMHEVEAGKRPSLAVLFVAFAHTDRLMRLVLLGALVLAVTVVAVMVVMSGVVARLDPATLALLEQGDVQALLEMDPRIQEAFAASATPLLIALLAGLVLSATLSYFAIPLIWFKRLPLGKAVVLGLLGMLRNWKAFLVLGLLLSVLALPAVLLSGLVLGLNATGTGGSPVLTMVMLTVAVLYQLLIFASQYVAFRDVFALEPPPAQRPPEEGQLVA
jgi:hypothetical protein